MTREQVQARITLAKMQREERRESVKETIQMLNNDFGTTSQSDGSVVNLLAPNFVMSTRRRLIAQLYPADPKFLCRPRVRGFEGRAAALASLLEYYWRELKVKEVMRRVIDDTLIYGYGIAKIGMGSLETGIRDSEDEEEALDRIGKENELLLRGEEVEVRPEDLHEIDLQLHLQVMQDPNFLEVENITVIIENFNEHLAQHEEYLNNPVPSFPTVAGKGPSYDWPFIESVGPDVFWDPMVINPQDSSYVVHCIKKRVSDVKDDPLYKGTADLTADSYNDDEFQAYHSFNNDMEDVTYVPDELGTITLYEMWDANTKTVSTWVESKPDPIRAPDSEAWPAYIAGFPFEWLTFTDMPGESHGPGILEYLKWPQKFLMRIYSELATHSDRSGVKFEIDENRLSQRETQDSIEAKLADPTSHVALFVQEAGAINQIHPAMVDPTKLTLVNLLQNVINENSGISAEMRGIGGSETATQASIMASAANILIMDAVDRLSRFQEKTAAITLGVIRQWGPDDQVFRVVTPHGEQWLNYNINDVQAEWQVEVDMPSPFQNEREKQEWLNMFHMFSPIMDPNGRQQFMLDGMRLFGIKQPQLYAESPSVEAQSNIQSENELFLLGQPKQATQGEDHEDHIQGHSMAVQQWQEAVNQMVQQIMMQNPSLQESPDAEQFIQQSIMQDPNGQRFVMATQIAQQHIQEHQQLMQDTGTEGKQGSRRRQSVPYPTGNVGRTESILSNQKQGT